MAAGVFQPIRLWDIEAFRQGILPPTYIQESASLNVQDGTPVVYNAARQLVACGTTFTQVSHITQDDSANAAAAGTQIPAVRIQHDQIWEVTLNEAFALNLISKPYGLVKDATTGYWYLSTADIGNQMTIVGADPQTAIGDTKSRVLAVFNRSAIFTDNKQNVGIYSASGAVDPLVPGTFAVTKAGVAALTLAAPVTGVQDGDIITLTSTTANAHTLTATGLLNTGSASVNVATFAAFAGAGLTLMAYGAKWNVLASTGITFS